MNSLKRLSLSFCCLAVLLFTLGCQPEPPSGGASPAASSDSSHQTPNRRSHNGSSIAAEQTADSHVVSPARSGTADAWSEIAATAGSNHPGAALAEEHCKRCHLVPSPDDLPSDRWDFVIAWMAHYFGYDSFEGPQRSVVLEELVQEVPTVERKVLETILDYYETESKTEVAANQVFPEKLTPTDSLMARPERRFLPDARTVTCVKIDSDAQKIFVGDARKKKLWEFTSQGTPIARHDCLGTQAVSVRVLPGGFEATLIGHFLEAGDAGKIMRVKYGSQGVTNESPLPEFFRLAHSHIADVDGDGNSDYLLSGFGGRFNGAFSVFWGKPDGDFTRQDLMQHNGALSSATLDVDEDGDLDILMLSAQGFHEFLLYRNDSKRQFKSEKVWHHRPSYGANGFRLIDLDKDDRPELVLFCGNNMELRNPPIRPHHGVYVFKHLGKAKFKQEFFYPLPAAVAVSFGDLDNDQDIDLVAVSSLPDWRVPDPVSTVVLKNKGGLDFDAATISGTEGMQWTSLDVGDADADGDVDLVLGMLDFVPAVAQDRLDNFNKRSGNQPSVLYVENLIDP